MILNLGCIWELFAYLKKIYRELTSSPKSNACTHGVGSVWGRDFRAAQVIIIYTSGQLQYLLTSLRYFTHTVWSSFFSFLLVFVKC